MQRPHTRRSSSVGCTTTRGTRFPSQAHIDQACSKAGCIKLLDQAMTDLLEVVKSCKKLSREDCCSLSPKQIRFSAARES